MENPKSWWTLIKDVLINNSKNNDVHIPPIKVHDDFIVNDKEKADEFNKFFISSSSLPDYNAELPEVTRVSHYYMYLTAIPITKQDVIDQVKVLDVSKAYGPDGISPRFIKEGVEAMICTLLRLFKLSLECCRTPTELKKANVVPLYKKGCKSDVTNYRPILLLRSVGKLFERIIFKYTYNHRKNNFVLSNFQSGFLPGRSTVTQLLEIKEVRVIFLDMSKAFDKVWHNGLLFKLKKSGINGNLLNWFTDYLSNRYQRVVINGQYSTWRLISAGVPQGSVLGPLMFLVYINDIIHAVKHCNFRMFADDTCIFREFEDHIDSTYKINQDLLSISECARKWKITFSAKKTKSFLMTNRQIHN